MRQMKKTELDLTLAAFCSKKYKLNPDTKESPKRIAITVTPASCIVSLNSKCDDK